MRLIIQLLSAPAIETDDRKIFFTILIFPVEILKEMLLWSIKEPSLTEWKD
jgi:hypothetical protein